MTDSENPVWVAVTNIKGYGLGDEKADKDGDSVDSFIAASLKRKEIAAQNQSPEVKAISDDELSSKEDENKDSEEDDDKEESDDDSDDDDNEEDGDKWKEIMDKAKKGHRPSLKDWAQDGLIEVFPAYVASLSDEYQYFVLKERTLRENDQKSNGQQDEEKKDNHEQKENDEDKEQKYEHDKVPALLNAETLTVDEFSSKYEAPCIPSVIMSIPAGYDGAYKVNEWDAVKNWSFDVLENDPELRNRRFKCGEDDDENIIKVKMRHFLQYQRDNKDDSPLYIFDSSFDDDDHAKRLLLDYRVPTYFSEDLFKIAGNSGRPPYRWFLIGPERSGTCVHIDPLATGAWNTLIRGEKRWVLFPPHLSKSLVKGKGLYDEDEEDDEAIHYFMYFLPRIKAKATEYAKAAGASIVTNNKDDIMNGDASKATAATDSSTQETDKEEINIKNNPYRNFACYEFTQHEGETVFVPDGWWHAVLNLTDTVAITQNFCSSRNFDRVWLKVRSGRKKFAWKWLQALEKEYPHLARRARQLNERDRYRMKFDPETIKLKEQARLEGLSSKSYQWKRS